ncbi:MAG: ArsR/SmtB family transcription factor [Anaerovoracaceae bacterium]|jgi:DNA-binding transcriptional ArsR family regulator
MADRIKLPHDHGNNMEALLERIPDEDAFKNVSDTFSLISDATRLKILWLLCHSEDCVVNIAAAVGMSSPAVSHHLRLLKQSGLIVSRKDGKEVYYTLADTEEATLVHKVVDDAFDMDCFKDK